MIYLEQGDLERAIADFDKAIEIGIVAAGTYYNRGRARFLLGLGSDAAADYQKAVELDPSYTDKPYSRDRPRPSDDAPAKTTAADAVGSSAKPETVGAGESNPH